MSPWENKDDDAEWNGHEDLELKVFLGLLVKKVEMIGVNFYISRLCLVFKKFEEKYEGKKIKKKVKEKKSWRKIKNKFKINKLFLYIFSNSFYLFSFFV